jgi:hypothetical protein
MNKLLSILLAGTIATGAALAQSPAKTGVDTGDLAGSNTPSGTGAANVGTNHTTTADKRAMRTGADTMGSTGAATDSTGTAGATGSMGASGDAGMTGKAGKGNGKISSKAKKNGKAEGEQAEDRTEIR